MKSRMGYALFSMIYQPMRKGNTRLIVLLANDDQLKQQRPVIELLHSLNDMNIVTRHETCKVAHFCQLVFSNFPITTLSFSHTVGYCCLNV